MDTASALAQKVLSIDGVKRLIEEHNTHQVLQVVQIIQKEKDNYKDYIVEISDGHSKYTVNFIQEAASEISSGRVIKTSIVNLLDVNTMKNQDGSPRIDVARVAVVNQEHKGIVGKPLDYGVYKSMGFKNPNGSNNLEDIQREIHEFIERSPMGKMCTNFGFSFIAGICAAYFLKRIAKIIAFSLGGTALFLKYLEYHGLITIHWKKWMPSVEIKQVIHFITFGSIGFAAGFYLGIKKELHHMM